MHRTCIAIVDASRARLFTLDRTSELGGVAEQMVETTDLVNPARRLTPSEQLTETRPGSSRVGTRGFAFDDHRDARTDALDRDFARQVAAEVGRAVSDRQVARLIVCASPHMLGELRRAGGYSRAGLTVEELDRDLVKLTPTQLRAQLADYGILPA